MKKKENLKLNKRKMKLVDFSNITVIQRVIISILCLLVLIVATKFIINLGIKHTINYKTANSETFLNNTTVTNNRENYWILNGIIRDFLYSYRSLVNIYKGNVSITNHDYYQGYTVEQYYDSLTDEYKSFLSRKEFVELSKTMLEKFVVDTGTIMDIKREIPIKIIYQEKDKDNFLVELNTAAENINSYIGISLNKNEKTYNIYYLE